MEKFSLCVARLELFRSKSDALVPCGLGTGFLYEADGGLYLVTNWHILTGVDPVSMQPIDADKVIPDTLRVTLKSKLVHHGRTALQNIPVDIPLYVRSEAIWYEHSTRQNVDVAALRMTITGLDDFGNFPVNKIDQEPKLIPYPGMDCFVLGFPEGMTGPAITPIWKRGSIASEPQYDYRSLPGFLIDTATRSGMSGSPVVARHSGIFRPEGGPVLGPNDILGTVEKFIGIYSGRIGDDPMGVQLGMVWREDVLADVLTCRTSGFNPLFC
jgi:hypothetical protein